MFQKYKSRRFFTALKQRITLQSTLINTHSGEYDTDEKCSPKPLYIRVSVQLNELDN
jgi:hypothetical protein